MRIIGGTHKGRTIPVRKNFPSRPTTDFAKENLFNILHNHLDFEGMQVLDLFAGTGNISYEFASRGAIVDAVEKNYQSVAFIRKNIAKLGLSSITPINADVFKVLPKLKKSYNLIFADPPYDMQYIEQIPIKVLEQDLLAKSGWFILEHSKKFEFKEHPMFREIRVYGSVHFSIFNKP